MLMSVGCSNVFGSISKWISTAERLDKNEGNSRFVSPKTAISLNTAIKCVIDWKKYVHYSKNV